MNDNKGTPVVTNGHAKVGRYLYADYSPFEEGRNFLDMLRNFVIVSRDVTTYQDDAQELQVVLGDAQRAQKEMGSKIAQFRTSVISTMDSFHKQYDEMTRSIKMETAGDLFIDTKNSLANLLANTENRFNQRSDDFNRSTATKITECNENAISKLESWLMNADYVMPYVLASKISSTVTISADGQSSDSKYNIECENTLIISNDPSQSAPPSMSYSFSIGTSDLEFWNSKKRISDLGIQMQLPVGLRTPVSTRLKKSFKFGLGDNEQFAEKEPEFIDIGGYYITFAKMENNRTLSVRLAAGPSNPPGQIEMQFNLDAVYEPNQTGGEGGMPKVNYISSDGSRNYSDLLQIKEIGQYADVHKIMLVGKMLADKIRILPNADVVSSRGKLSSISVNGKNAVAASDSDSYYDAHAVASLLELLAGSFRPLVQKLKSKSPVAGELILKQQLEGGDRKEYVIRTEELESMLLSSKDGKRILHSLGLSTDAVNTLTSVADS